MSDALLWRMSTGKSDSGMDESHRTRRVREEMAGTDPATTAERVISERVLSPTRFQRSGLLLPAETAGGRGSRSVRAGGRQREGSRPCVGLELILVSGDRL